MKTVRLIFMAVFFYILGLNTHNSLWKWLDHSRRANDNLPSYISAVPDTVITELSPDDQCIIDSMFAPTDRQLGSLKKTMDELQEFVTKAEARSNVENSRELRPKRELRAFELPALAIQFNDTTGAYLRDSLENDIIENVRRQRAIEDSLRRRRIQRDSIFQNQ